MYNLTGRQVYVYNYAFFNTIILRLLVALFLQGPQDAVTSILNKTEITEVVFTIAQSEEVHDQVEHHTLNVINELISKC